MRDCPAAHTPAIVAELAIQSHILSAQMHKVLGLVLILVSITVFTLYTTWAILIPLRLLDGYPEIQPYLQYFPEYRYASILPASLLAIALAFVAVFVGIVKSRATSKKKAA